MINKSSAYKEKLAKVELNCYLNIAAYFHIAKNSKITGCFLESVKLNCHLDKAAYLDIAGYSEIASRILENVKLKKRDKNWRA